MTDEPHAVRAAELVADPDRYEEFAQAYADEVTFYSELRNSAQKELETFAEYLELRRVFLERGPTAEIRDRLEDRLDRSFKNMILGTSPRGRAYSIQTLREANDRLDQFAALGVERPSLLSVVKTTLEHLFDDTEADAARCYDILDGLLTETPEGSDRAIEYVARARLGEELRLAEAPVQHVTSALSAYCDVVDDPAPDDDRPVGELVAAARDRPFVDERKERLYAAALHHDPPVRVPFDYLYVVAHEAVESYRHSGDDPRRADLLLAQRHLDVLAAIAVPGWDDRRATYARSYRHVAQAIQLGGGQWLSDRAAAPSPEWTVVSRRYGLAAEALRGVDDVRAVKYLSKAFRHGAHATETWETRRRIHRTAQQTVRAMEFADSDAVVEAVDGTLQVHRCREAEASAHVTLADGAYEDAVDAAREADRLAGTVPQQSLRLDGIEFIREFCAGRVAEQAGDYESARQRYAVVMDESDVATHRHGLVRVKRALDDGNHAEALSVAETQFEPDSLVLAATRAAAGIVPGDVESVEITVDLRHAAVDPEALRALLRVYSADGVGGAALSDRIAEQLLAL